MFSNRDVAALCTTVNLRRESGDQAERGRRGRARPEAVPDEELRAARTVADGEGPGSACGREWSGKQSDRQASGDQRSDELGGGRLEGHLTDQTGGAEGPVALGAAGATGGEVRERLLGQFGQVDRVATRQGMVLGDGGDQRFLGQHPVRDALRDEALTTGVADGVRSAGRRLIVVGGAAPLQVPGTARIALDDPRWVPTTIREIAAASCRQLEILRATSGLDWTYLAPAADFRPGNRTGAYRTGGTDLVIDGSGQSSLSMEDYAIALLDEVESPTTTCTVLSTGH